VQLVVVVAECGGQEDRRRFFAEECEKFENCEPEPQEKVAERSMREINFKFFLMFCILEDTKIL
jgi:hypothetical protein